MTPFAVAIDLVVGGLGFALGVAWSAYRTFRGTHVVTCPEDCEPAAVQLDAAHAALTAPLGSPGLRLRDCTRWPDREGCTRGCVLQVRAHPEASRVRAILSRWYLGRSCALCGWPFEEPARMDFEPALLGPDGIVEWDQVAPERLAGVLASHDPVCWNCRVIETFRRQHPGLVVDRSTRSPAR